MHTVLYCAVHKTVVAQNLYSRMRTNCRVQNVHIDWWGIGAHSLHIAYNIQNAYLLCESMGASDLISFDYVCKYCTARPVSAQKLHRNQTVVAKCAHRGREGHGGCPSIRIYTHTQMSIFSCKPLFAYTELIHSYVHT